MSAAGGKSLAEVFKTAWSAFGRVSEEKDAELAAADDGLLPALLRDALNFVQGRKRVLHPSDDPLLESSELILRSALGRIGELKHRIYGASMQRHDLLADMRFLAASMNAKAITIPVRPQAAGDGGPEGKFYWVRLAADKGWEPASFENGQWWLTGGDTPVEPAAVGHEVVHSANAVAYTCVSVMKESNGRITFSTTFVNDKGKSITVGS